jgi:uncharacterized SAM-binding protein YcdF (DUF218 family)
MIGFAPVRIALKVVAIVVAGILLYFVVTLVQVWLTSREYDPHPAGAILVMGAAQYNGLPSPDLKARLDEALSLYRRGDAKLIVVTGNKKPGDRFTEAESGANYLEGKGVPPSHILRAGGDNTYQNVVGAADLLSPLDVRAVLVTTDPFHEARSMAIASEEGLDPSPTPTKTSPITGWSRLPYFMKEAVGVGFGRIIGFDHLEWLHDT